MQIENAMQIENDLQIEIVFYIYFNNRLNIKKSIFKKSEIVFNMICEFISKKIPAL